MAVASIGKPIAFLKRSIHAPGFGRNFSHLGWKLRMTYGAASPAPTERNINTMMGAGCAKANPSAPARNGAEQGVASAVARMPLKNAPLAPSLDASVEAVPIAPPPSVTSNRPKRFNATSVTITTMPTRK